MATTDINAPALLRELNTKRSEYTKALLSRNTLKGYSAGWSIFQRWADSMGLCSLPASTDTVALFATDQITTRGLTVATASNRVAAIQRKHLAAGHPSPATYEIHDLFRGMRRVRCEQPQRVLPLTVQELRLLSTLQRADDTPRAVRDWTLMLVGFGAALRNSNSASLMLSDVEFVEDGAILRIRREKNDQEGVGRSVGLPHGKHPETCPVIALKRWIACRGSLAGHGPLFTRLDKHPPPDRPLRPERIGQLVQEQIKRIGLDPALYGGHSLRAGFVTEAGTAGAGVLLITSQTGHRDLSSMRQYFRKQDVFRENPFRLLDL